METTIENKKEPSRLSTGGYRLLTREEREALKKLVSEVQRPKYWKEKRLFR